MIFVILHNIYCLAAFTDWRKINIHRLSLPKSNHNETKTSSSPSLPWAKNLHTVPQQSYISQTILQHVHRYHSVSRSPDIHASSSTETFPVALHGNMDASPKQYKKKPLFPGTTHQKQFQKVYCSLLVNDCYGYKIVTCFFLLIHDSGHSLVIAKVFLFVWFLFISALSCRSLCLNSGLVWMRSYI